MYSKKCTLQPVLKPLNLNGIQSVSSSNSTSVLWTSFTKECSFPVWMIYHDVPNCNISRWRNCPFPIIIKIKTRPSTFSPGDVFFGFVFIAFVQSSTTCLLVKILLGFLRWQRSPYSARHVCPITQHPFQAQFSFKVRHVNTWIPQRHNVANNRSQFVSCIAGISPQESTHGVSPVLGTCSR